MDDKALIMTLIEYHNLFFIKLDSKIEKDELNEFFFWLIEYYCGINRMKYILNPNYIINNTQKSNLFKAIEHLKKNMPIQYVIGESEFMNLKFHLNNKVLIPRPETEELVSWVISTNPINKKILDIGTGSGCIAISLAKFIKSSNLTAWDINQEILEIARKNAFLNEVKVLFEVQDISSIKSDKKFDIIVSNPPYICNSEKKKINNNVLLFEPVKALFVDDNDPLFYYYKIIDFAKQNLNNNGNIFFEIAENQDHGISELLIKAGFHDIELRKDYRLKNRMVRASFK